MQLFIIGIMLVMVFYIIAIKNGAIFRIEIVHIHKHKHDCEEELYKQITKQENQDMEQQANMTHDIIAALNNALYDIGDDTVNG